MPVTLELHDARRTTYESALKKDENLIHQILQVAAKKELFQELWDRRDTIAALTRHHLGLGDGETCTVAPEAQWIPGSFNVCIPVEVRSAGSRDRKLIFRCAMPHRLAEVRYPGSVDEKVGCEVGTYVWIQGHCPDIRVPHLYGFGFSNHAHFTHERQRPFYIRLACMFRRFFHNLGRGRPILSQYTANPAHHRLPTAYILLEYISPDAGQMLSNTWDRYRGDPVRRGRLFRGLARLVLSLARVPQPRIGSFRFHDDCTISLTNRPLGCSIMILENDGAPRTIQRDETYAVTEPFVADMLTFHDSSFLANPNAAFDAEDCRGQMAARTLLRALSHHYLRRELRNGPFVLQLTDLHPSNIFVDAAWNVFGFVDLEWVCALPAEMLAAPCWLTGRGIDEIVDDRLEEFDGVRREFMRILEEEEGRMAPSLHKPALSVIMQESWESGAVWFWRCLSSVNATASLVEDHISPQFCSWSSKGVEILCQYWCPSSTEVIRRKVGDYQGYAKDLAVLFGQE